MFNIKRELLASSPNFYSRFNVKYSANTPLVLEKPQRKMILNLPEDLVYPILRVRACARACVCHPVYVCNYCERLGRAIMRNVTRSDGATACLS